MLFDSLYCLATGLGAPAIRGLLAYRQARGKEDPARLGERLGRPGLPRPAGPVIWLHGASVGEAQALFPLIAALRRRYPAVTPLLTTGTVTSAALAARRLPEGALHQFVPVDTPGAAARFVAHWRPDLVLWSESDFWPNLLRAAHGTGCPLVLLNGRMSERSFARWRGNRALRGGIAGLLGRFTLCLGQTRGDADRLAALGAPATDCLGNLKFAVPPLPAEPADLDTASALLGDRPRWLAASTHDGEEVLAGRVHKALAARHPGLLTIVLPRHPERAAAVAETLRADGLRVQCRSAGWPDGATDILVGDTLGEMGLYLRLADIVFMGKTLVKGGGQNPLEPARLGKAILWGPRMENFPEIAPAMTAIAAARAVDDVAGLEAAVSELLEAPVVRRVMGSTAKAYAEAEAAVLDRVLDRLEPHLAALAPLPASPSQPLSNGGEGHADP